MRAAKSFAASRRLRSSREGMNRLYVVEPSRTVTGNMADHRLRLPAGDIEGYAYALAVELDEARRAARARAVSVRVETSVGRRHPGEVARRRRQGPGCQPRLALWSWWAAASRAVVHALAHAINAGLGAIGAAVTYAPVADPDELDVAADLKALTDAMGAKQVDGLIILGGNPVLDAPADLGFRRQAGQGGFQRARLALRRRDERQVLVARAPRPRVRVVGRRAVARRDRLRSSSRSSLRSTRGAATSSCSPSWPTRRSGPRSTPSANTANGLLLATRQLFACGVPDAMGKLSARTPRATPSRFTSMTWIASGTARSRRASFSVPRRGKLLASPSAAAIAAAIDARKAAGTRVGPLRGDVRAVPEDGRRALRQQHVAAGAARSRRPSWSGTTRPSCPRPARRSSAVDSKDVVKITAGDRSITAAVWIVPGQADHSIALTLGWGRTKAGRIGNGRGFDVYPLRTTRNAGLRLGRHRRQDGRRAVLLRADPGEQLHRGSPDRSRGDARRVPEEPNFPELDAPPPRALPLWEQADYSKGHQWGMTIDLNACTGCSACVIACMAENNVPVVGKREVWRGREMHWLRIDRYYVERAEHRRHGGGSRGRLRAAHVRALRRGALRERLPGQRHHARARGAERDGVQPVHRHALLRQQLPVQGPQVQLPELAQRRRCGRRPAGCRRRCRCSRTRTSPCGSAASWRSARTACSASRARRSRPSASYRAGARRRDPHRVPADVPVGRHRLRRRQRRQQPPCPAPSAPTAASVSWPSSAPARERPTSGRSATRIRRWPAMAYWEPIRALDERPLVQPGSTLQGHHATTSPA